MVLIYKFEYFSNNFTLIHNIKACLKDFEINYKISKENNHINLFVESTKEILDEFSKILSTYLPMSIFLKNVEVESVDEFPNFPDINYLDFAPLTFCTKCLKAVEEKGNRNYYNPFVFCEDCGQDLQAKDLILFDGKKEIKKSNYIEYFEYTSKLINDGKKVKIKTLSGEFVFSILDSIDKNKKDNIKLLCADLNSISDVLVASKQEIIALASIEKPSINLNINEVFKSKNILQNENIDVRYANDMILYLLCLELEKYNIKFLAYWKSDTFDSSLTFISNTLYKKIEIPKISILDNGQVLILKSKNYDKSLDDVYKEFSEKNKSQFMVLLGENYLFEKTIFNTYASTKHEDGLTLYSTKIDGMIDIFKYELPTSMNELFDEIKKDTIGVKLMSNYEKSFPDIYKTALSFDLSLISENSIYSIWKIVSIILGFEMSILTGAHNALGNKGPRIDYKLDESDKIYKRRFNIYKLIQSGISYKLAGTNDNLICLGYIESFAHFVSSCVDMVNEEMKLDGISLCGDLFADKLISSFVHKSITKNYKIYYNKDFPIQID
ncbi:MAG: hypothetical protein WA916_09980 [Arcobacter sp.]|uniref:hypothetical protein n=1 Tax=Arcobacter sp. TaxID=1872629 RepID=UPI003C74F7C6